MRLIERFRRFWYVPTIKEMQAQMLRDIPWIYKHRQLADAMHASTVKTMASTLALIKKLYGE